MELVETGASSTVDAAVAASRNAGKVASLRQLRTDFLSQIAMEQALALPRDPAVVSKGDFRGDFQMHSTWSDGGETHRGDGGRLSRARPHVHGHHRSLLRSADRARHEHGGRRAGSTARSTRSTSASPASSASSRASRRTSSRTASSTCSRRSAASSSTSWRRRIRSCAAIDDQTSRMLRAVTAPGVAILGHPQGRMYNSRAGVRADWPRVFATAAKRGVAIEIDGNWHRQDVRPWSRAPGARRGLRLRARQRRALDRRAALHRLLDRARAPRRDPGGAGDQLLERRAAGGVDGGERR